MSAHSDTARDTAQIHVHHLRVERLDIRKGEFLAITGPSGSGKSTLVNLVAGFLAPSEGQILKNGLPIAGSGPDRIVVFQNHALFPWLTAFENVAYGLKKLPLSRAELDSRVREALAVTGLGEFASAYPSTLSGGMCQRVALARALVLRPEILLLDEPFASLDAANRQNLQNELLDLWKAFGWTVVLVTHRIEEAVCMADRVAMLFPPPAGLRHIFDIALPRPRACPGTVELFAEYADGLQAIDGYSHIYLIYHLHRAKPGPLLVKPFLQDIVRGVFSTRAPGRPNTIGLSPVRLLSRKGNLLHVAGMDALDGTPLLDIKPYSRRIDCVRDTRDGWQDEIDDATASLRGLR